MNIWKLVAGVESMLLLAAISAAWTYRRVYHLALDQLEENMKIVNEPAYLQQMMDMSEEARAKAQAEYSNPKPQF